MRLVIKIGGATLDDKELVRKCARTVAELSGEGHQVAVVHGGGAALTRTLAELGRKTEFINGMRVTDAGTRDVALMVLAGQLNKLLVAAIGAAGQPAVGLCGGDFQTFRARKRNGGVDLGFVGEICSVETRWLRTIWQNGGIPVISSIALGMDGEYYNINADQMASECAVACQANALIFLTDVPGVKGRDGVVMRWLDLSLVPALVQDRVVSGGMLPKLEACRQALSRGVERVRILPAAKVAELSGFCFSKLDCGTEVTVQNKEKSGGSNGHEQDRRQRSNGDVAGAGIHQP